MDIRGRWITELVWRDFYTCILAAFPRVYMGRLFSEQCASVRWEESEEMLKRWQEGKTFVRLLMWLRQMSTMGESNTPFLGSKVKPLIAQIG